MACPRNYYGSLFPAAKPLTVETPRHFLNRVWLEQFLGFIPESGAAWWEGLGDQVWTTGFEGVESRCLFTC